MNGKIDYFVRGYTGLGEVNYIESNVKEIKDVFILKAANEKTATLFLKEFIKLVDDDTVVEVIKHPDFIQALDGVIIREKSLAILTTPFIKCVSSHSHLIDLTKYTKLPVRFIAKDRRAIVEKAINHFSKSLEIHKELKRINREEMDFKIADEVIKEFINKEINIQPNLDKETHVYKRMFGINTYEGITEGISDLIVPIKNKIYLKGAPGTGKSYFMKKIMNEVANKGYDIEVYKCPFDSNRIDMVIIREMNYCIFAYESNEPSKEDGYIIDLQEIASSNVHPEENKILLKQLNEDYTKNYDLGVTELSKLQEFAGSIENSEIKLTNNEVEKILKDYKVNY